jgi:hypothetical protein
MLFWSVNSRSSPDWNPLVMVTRALSSTVSSGSDTVIWPSMTTAGACSV